MLDKRNQRWKPEWLKPVSTTIFKFVDSDYNNPHLDTIKKMPTKI